AHLPIVAALRKAGMETRIERVATQNAGSTVNRYRFEVVGWTPDVSPPRPTSPEILRGLIEQDAGASQRDLAGQTGEDLWNTLIRAAEAVEQTTPTVTAQVDPAEKARRDLGVERENTI